MSDDPKVRRVRRTKEQMLADAVEVTPTVEPDAPAKEPMNELALRIWNGQSLSAHEDWRVMRVIEGLKSHGYDITGLELPVENIGQYL